MAKNKISEFDVNPDNNTDINNINIAEGCAPSGINNAIRQLMSDLKEQLTGASGDPFTVGGAFAANGGATLGDASGDALTINSSAVSIPNGLNFGSNNLVLSGGNVGIGMTPSGSYKFEVSGNSNLGNLNLGSQAYLSWGGNTNLSIQGTSTNNLLFITNGTERARIDSSGNVGIGTNSPATQLQVSSTTAADGATFRLSLANTSIFGGDKYGQIQFVGNDSSSSASGIRAYVNGEAGGANGEGTLVFGTANTNAAVAERMRIDSSGNVGIGTSSPTAGYRITLVGAAAGIYMGATSGTARNWGIGAGIIANAGEFGIFDITANAERLRITTSGLVEIRTAFQAGTANNSTGALNVVGCIRYVGGGTQYGMQFIPTNNNTSAIYFSNAAGAGVGDIVTSATTTTYNTASDYRLKENIAPMIGALAKVKELKPVTYTWKSDGSSGQGFIAHELQEVVPDAVTGEKDAMRTEQYEISPAISATYDEKGNELTPAVEAVMGEREVPKYQGIDTSLLVATLTAAIQEQQAIINDLKARIEALENK